MTSERWQQVEALFGQALDAPAAERPQFLGAIGDVELRREVESLLRAHGEAGSFFEEPERFFPSESFEADTLSPGQIIDRYRVIREIGRGGMGAVFLAERADRQFEMQVALKLIKRGMDTDSVLRRFNHERQILASLEHPNIARLLDGGTTEDGLPYFVMEYIQGDRIDHYAQEHQLSIAARLELFRQVCGAVSYAHQHLVVHRDLKPSNMLVTSDGVPKLLDFGIAKIIQPNEDGETLATVTAVPIMTPEYASPEQIEGAPATTLSDVYSLGAILYELLTGRKPFESQAHTPHDRSRAIIQQEPRRPSTVVPVDRKSKIDIRKSLQGDLDNMVLMAMRRDTARRYRSVDQFSEDIRRHLAGRPVIARPDTFSYRAGKFVQRNKASLAAAALVVLLLIGGIIATSWQARIALKQKKRAERRFNDVRKLAHSVLFDYHDAVRYLPGATKVRELLVKDALTYLDSLATESHDDPALQRELGAAYERVGDVRGGLGGNLGDPKGALESYRKALSIREAVIALNPRDPQARHDQANSYRKIGSQLLDTKEAKAGVEYLRKALALYLELAREQSANDELQLDLAACYDGLGRAQETFGDFAGSLEQFRTALAICEKLTASNPRDQRYRRALWNSQTHVATILYGQGDVAGSIEANRKALALAEGLLADDPLSAEHRRALVATYNNAAECRSQSDKPAALEYFRKAATLQEELLAADPANAVTRKSLALLHKRIADFAANMQDSSESLLHFTKAREGFEKIAADAPSDLLSRIRVATCGAGVAGMRARLGEADSAQEECRKSIALLGAIKEDPANAVHRSFRAEAYEYLGYAYNALATAAQGSPAETKQHTTAARDMFQQSLDILEDLRGRGLLNAADTRWARDIAGEVAKCDAALAR